MALLQTGMADVIATFWLPLVATVIGTLLALEAQAWAPHVSRWLLRRTVALLPEDLPADSRARWKEEMEADLASFAKRPLGGLVFALRVRLRGGKGLALALAEECDDEEASAPVDQTSEPTPSWPALLVAQHRRERESRLAFLRALLLAYQAQAEPEIQLAGSLMREVRYLKESGISPDQLSRLFEEAGATELLVACRAAIESGDSRALMRLVRRRGGR